MKQMALDQKKTLFIALGLFVALLPMMFITVSYIKATAAALLAIAAVLVCVLIRKRSIYSINKLQVFLLLAVTAAVFLILYYFSGIYVGFYKNYPGFSFGTLIQHIIPCAVIIIATEIIRAVLLAQKVPGITVLTFMIALLADVMLGEGVSLIGEMHRFLDIVFLHFLPAITANVLYMHVTKRYGAAPNIAFRLMISLIPQVTSILPAINEVIESFVKILFPLLVYAFLKELYKSGFKNAKESRNNKWTAIPMVLTVVLMISAVMLISCQVRYGLLVIATPSMSGSIEVGDAVFFEDSKHADIKIGDVILFSKDSDAIIVHRVVDIENINNQYRYYTKGDANQDLDYGYVTASQVKGVVHFKIPLIGQPSLWLRELFN